MKLIETFISGVYIIENDLQTDSRGGFTRVYCENEMASVMNGMRWVQINHSYNTIKGTFRGMHYQLPPFHEKKLIRCITGKMMDIILDLRENSTTFLQSIQIEISSGENKMIFLPEGVAHGFQTLEDNTQLIYHHSAFYSKKDERGIRYNDPMVNIQLPIEISSVSEKDLNYSLLEKDFKGLVV